MNSPKRLLIRNQVQSQFDRAAATYDSAARLQRRIGNALLTRVTANHSPQSSIIDLGCGTGTLLKQLQDAGFDQLTGLDLSSGMIAESKAKVPAAEYHHAAIESIPCSESCFDVALSNVALQWCDVDAAAAEIYRVLRQDGKLYLSSFTKGTLGQWHDAFVAGGFESRVHPMPEPDEIEQAFAGAGFTEVESNVKTGTTSFDSIESMFASIKLLGATNAMKSRARAISKREYVSLRNHFRKRLESDGQLELDFVWTEVVAKKLARR